MDHEQPSMARLAQSEDDTDTALALRQRLQRQQLTADDGLAKAKAHVAQLQATLHTMRADQAHDEAALSAAETKRDRATHAIEFGLGSEALAQEQHQVAQARIDALETTILERLEGMENASHDLLDAQDALTQQQAIYQADKPAVDEQLSRVMDDLHRAQLASQAACTALSRDTATTVGELRKRRGRATARLVDRVCQSCRRVAPMQVAADIMSARAMTRCDGCSRYLVAPATTNDKDEAAANA